MNISRILAIVKRLLLLGLRFKWDFLFKGVISPVKNIFAFFVVYWGFFNSGAQNIGPVNQSNYVVFLLFAMAFNAVFTKAFSECSDVFLFEKYWQSIQGLLVSPAKSYEILLGYSIVQALDLLPVILAALCGWYVGYTPTVIQAAIVVGLIGVMSLLLFGIGFMKAGFVLADENTASLFMPISWVLLFLSCFYYPIESLPGFLRPFVLANPIYHAGFSIVEMAIHGKLVLSSVVYATASSVVFSALGAYVTSKVWKKEGIQGY